MFRSNLCCLFLMLSIAAPVGADEQIWQEVEAVWTQSSNTASRLDPGTSARQSVDRTARRYRVNDSALRASLQRVSEVVGPGSLKVIRLPMPDGSLAEFEIHESPIMEDELAQKYPGIRTFQLYGIDDPLASGRADITPAGFHAMLHTSQGRLFIDPDRTLWESDRYLARSGNSSASPGYTCGVDELDVSAHTQAPVASRLEARSTKKLLSYKLAVAATDNYVNAIFNPADIRSRKEQAQAEIVTAINRVNQIYQRDFGIVFKLPGRNDELIELAGEAGFSNDNAPALINQNQVWIDTVLGSSNYDVGHVFSTGFGGLASLGSVCKASSKARGVSGIGNPVGDPFYIDFVAHELGHQFNAKHSFNGSTQSCASGRTANSAYEPGSGSTIMAYAGLCGLENLQGNSDATFHSGSISQINRFISRGGSCFKVIDTRPANPNPPVVNALTNRTIPTLTAFVLDAKAKDKDPGSTLSYQWDQMDTGCSTNAASYGSDNGSNALFRSYLPQVESERHFPALGTQLKGLYDDAEVLPCQDREMNFRVTVRDGLSGLDTADIKLSAKNSAGRFRITNLATPGVTITNPNPVVVEWDVAGTDQPPINCPNVDIELMTFSNRNYKKYSIHPLSMMTANDGSETFPIMPDTKSHPRARIRVKCSNNVFYDISDVDFAITGIGAGGGDFDDDDNLTFFNNNGTTGVSVPACRINVSCKSVKPPRSSSGSGSSSRGGGVLDYRGLLMLSGLLVLGYLRRRTVARFANLGDLLRADLARPR